MAELTNINDKQQFISQFDTFLFDCDGVLWRGSELIENVENVISMLRGMGKQLLFVTNNASKSRKEYVEKFNSFGIECTENEIFSSAYATCYYLKNILKINKVYCIGMKGFTHELELQGIEWDGSYKDNVPIQDMAHVNFEPDPSIEAVVLGMDLDINYRKIAKAFTYLHSNKECHFVATNADTSYPSGNTIYPGTGALLATLTTPLKRQPTIIGKPHATMLDVVVDRFHLDRKRTCMIGDRLDTDILFGQHGGMKTLLVLTGVTTRQDLSTCDIQPDYIINSLGDLK